MGSIGVGVSVGGGQQAWTPRRLAGLLLWLAADYGVSSGETLASFASATSESLSIADNAELSTGTADFWFATRCRADSLPSTFPVVCGKNATTSANLEWDLHVDQANNRFRFQSGGAAFRQVSQSGTMTIGQLYSVIGYHDSVNDLNGIAIDGGAFATGTTSTTEPSDTTSALRFGARNGTPDRFWNGLIGRSAFGKAPPGGIAAIATTIRDRFHNSGNGLAYSEITAQEKTAWGLIAYWSMTETSGQRNDSHGTNHLTDNNTVTSASLTVALADGVTVSQVTDRSSQANHATQVAYANRPTYQTAEFGAKPAIRFDGTDDGLALTAIALTGDFTLSLTLKVTATGGAYLGHSSGTGKLVQTNDTTLTITNDAGSSVALTHDALDTAVHELTIVRASNVITRYLDGLEDGTDTLSGTITLDRLGVVGSSTTPLTADLADVILYDRAYT